jgi:hypothetical protein
MAGWKSAGRDCLCLTLSSTSWQRVSHAAIIENKRLGEVLAWIKQQQDKQPHYRGNLAGPRRSNQKAGLMKDRVDRLAQGKKPGSRPARRARRPLR